MILADLLKNIDAEQISADLNIDIAGISCNSASIKPGWLFAAIEGYKTDGHNYIEDAVKRGASCVLCQRKPNANTPHIIVEDSRKALALASAAWFDYPARKMKLIGITGTNGKTTVSYLIKHIIEKCAGSKAGLMGTIANLIGEKTIDASLTTPDSLDLHAMLAKMAQEGCQYAVMEVSSHALCLSRVHGIEFEIGIFTNLTPEHLDFHKSMDDYASAKAMLFPSCRQCIINIDDRYAGRMLKNCKETPVTFGIENGAADYSAKDISLEPRKTCFSAQGGGETVRIEAQIPGMFTVYNALAAYAAGRALGFESGDIANALADCPGVRGRAEILPLGRDFDVMIDYAHKPDALENIIKTARLIASGRVVTVFGCGGDRDKAKRPRMGEIASELSDLIYITSDNPRTEEPRAIIDEILAGIGDAAGLREKGRLKVVENRREAIRQALEILRMGDMLVIAGKGHETYQITGAERTHFDDREVVYEFLTSAG